MTTYSIDNGRLTQHGQTPLTRADFDRIAGAMGGYAVLRKVGFVAARTASERELVITYRKGKETESVAEPGDRIVINLDAERCPIVNDLGQPDRYTIRQATFPTLYEPTAEVLKVDGAALPIYRAKNTVHAVLFRNGFDICPPWGGRQVSPSGYLFYSPLTGEVYGCEKEAADKTYERAGHND